MPAVQSYELISLKVLRFWRTPNLRHKKGDLDVKITGTLLRVRIPILLSDRFDSKTQIVRLYRTRPHGQILSGADEGRQSDHFSLVCQIFDGARFGQTHQGNFLR